MNTISHTQIITQHFYYFLDYNSPHTTILTLLFLDNKQTTTALQKPVTFYIDKHDLELLGTEHVRCFSEFLYAESSPTRTYWNLLLLMTQSFIPLLQYHHYNPVDKMLVYYLILQEVEKKIQLYSQMRERIASRCKIEKNFK